MKIIMYGAPICGDCVIAKEKLLENKDVTLDYRNIIESTAVLKEFLSYRDNESIFDDVKATGKIGIPFFILEDGTKTLQITSYIDIALENKIQSCSIDSKGNC
ncbi:glutaredoxin [Anaerosporobacter sp.]